MDLALLRSRRLYALRLRSGSLVDFAPGSVRGCGSPRGCRGFTRRQIHTAHVTLLVAGWRGVSEPPPSGGTTGGSGDAPAGERAVPDDPRHTFALCNDSRLATRSATNDQVLMRGQAALAVRSDRRSSKDSYDVERAGDAWERTGYIGSRNPCPASSQPISPSRCRSPIMRTLTIRFAVRAGADSGTLPRAAPEFRPPDAALIHPPGPANERPTPPSRHRRAWPETLRLVHHADAPGPILHSRWRSQSSRPASGS